MPNATFWTASSLLPSASKQYVVTSDADPQSGTWYCGLYSSGTTTFSIGAAVISGGIVCDPSTQHCYEVVQPNTVLSWSTALEAANQRVYNGMNGYLMTITSASESTFVQGNLASFSANAWIGGSATSGTLQWSTGPEMGTGIQLSSGGCLLYCNFAANQPGNLNGNPAPVLYINAPGSSWFGNYGGSINAGYSAYVVEYSTDFLGACKIIKVVHASDVSLQVGCRMARSTRSLPVRASGCFGPLVLPVVVRPCHAQ